MSVSAEEFVLIILINLPISRLSVKIDLVERNEDLPSVQGDAGKLS